MRFKIRLNGDPGNIINRTCDFVRRQRQIRWERCIHKKATQWHLVKTVIYDKGAGAWSRIRKDSSTNYDGATSNAHE